MNYVLSSMYFSNEVNCTLGGIRNFLITKMGQPMLVFKSQLPPYLKRWVVGKAVRPNMLGFEMLRLLESLSSQESSKDLTCLRSSSCGICILSILRCVVTRMRPTYCLVENSHLEPRTPESGQALLCPGWGALWPPCALLCTSVKHSNCGYLTGSQWGVSTLMCAKCLDTACVVWSRKQAFGS